MKLLLLNMTAVTCMLIVACSSNNPLLTQDPKATATFIFNASSAAQDVLDTSMTRMAGGYEACMLDEVKDAVYCPKLFELMIKYARQSDSPYKNISVAQLKNTHSYEHFQKYLANAMFD